MGYIVYMVEKRNTNKILGVKPEVKRPVGRHRYENNIKIKFKSTEYMGMDWILVAW